MSKVTIADFSNTPPVDQVGIEERIARLNSRSIKKESKISGLKLALNMIDLTTLEGKDTEGKSIFKSKNKPYSNGAFLAK